MEVNSFSTIPIKVPSEPPPVPCISESIGSNEESFVVLGKSLISGLDELMSIENNIPGASIIPGAKLLINEELAKIEQASLSKQCTSNEGVVSEPVPQREDKITQSFITAISIPEPVTSNEVNKAISIASITSSEVISEELQNKVSGLIDENIRLKDTILQNNMSMKSLYERVVAWQNDVQKVHDCHKQKFIEAKQCIADLKTENQKLKQDLEKLTATWIMQEDQKNNQAEANLIDVKIRDECFSLNLEDAKKIKDLEGNMKQLEEKLLLYEQTLEDSYKKVRSLEMELRDTKIAKDAESLQQNEDTNMLIVNTQEMSKELSLKSHQLTETIFRLNEKDKQVSYLKEVEQNLQTELEDLKAQLEEAKIGIWKQKTKENDNEKSLLIRIQALKDELAKKQCNVSEVTPEEFIYLKQQLMQSQMAFTASEQERVAAIMQRDDMKQEISKLQIELQEKQSESDDLFALKTQVDVYKNDFELERESKEAIKIENTKLSEDIQNLHRRNQQLQEELELLRERNFVYVEGSSSGQTRHSNPNDRTSCVNLNPIGYNCPKCDFGFSTINALDNHLSRCLETD